MLSVTFSIQEANRAINESSSSIEDLEAQLNNNESDELTRVKLIGYYWAYRSTHGKQWLQHVRWLIEHFPEANILMVSFAYPASDSDLIAEVESLWKSAVRNENVSAQALCNAAAFYSRTDNEHHAKELLELAIAKEPTYVNAKKQLYELIVCGRKEPIADSDRALELCKSCIRIDPADTKHYINLAVIAMESRSIELASETAEKLICIPQADDLDGHIVHIAQSILGRVALRQGDVKEGLRRLDIAAQSFSKLRHPFIRPDLLLPAELVNLGFLEEVSSYLRTIEPNWPPPDQLDSSWFDIVSRGEIPERWERTWLF